jgi:hypothetical protein
MVNCPRCKSKMNQVDYSDSEMAKLDAKFYLICYECSHNHDYPSCFIKYKGVWYGFNPNLVRNNWQPIKLSKPFIFR